VCSKFITPMTTDLFETIYICLDPTNLKIDRANASVAIYIFELLSLSN